MASTKGAYYYTKEEIDEIVHDIEISGTGDPDYHHTDNNFTDAYKTKLDGLKNYTAGTGISISNNGTISCTFADGDSEAY